MSIFFKMFGPTIVSYGPQIDQSHGENRLSNKTTYFCVEAINSKQKVGGNLVTWYIFTFAVWRKRES